MFFGTKFLSLVVFLVTVGWAVMGQDIFGRQHIQKIGHSLSEKVILNVENAASRTKMGYEAPLPTSQENNPYESSYMITASYH